MTWTSVFSCFQVLLNLYTVLTDKDRREYVPLLAVFMACFVLAVAGLGIYSGQRKDRLPLPEAAPEPVASNTIQQEPEATQVAEVVYQDAYMQCGHCGQFHIPVLVPVD